MEDKHNEEALVGLLNDYLADFKQPVKITDGYHFDFEDTVNKIELYVFSKFKSGDKDAQGNKKYFFNIVNPQCGNATKNIDLDRKDITVRAIDDAEDKVKALLYNSELKYWMRKNNIGLLMNKISENLPRYGSCVLKKVGKDIKFVPLKRLKIDPAVSNKEHSFDIQSPYIIEELAFQPSELEKMKGNGWDEDSIDEVVESYRLARKANNLTDIKVYEMYGEFKNADLGFGEKGWTKAVVFIAKGFTERNGEVRDQNEVLYIKKLDTFPYKKIDYFTIEGRALGLGIPEMLFDAQQRWNEMANQKALSMRVSSKHLFQTRDMMVEKNILSDLLDGDIMKVNSEITPIATEERNLAAYNSEEKNIMEVVRSNANAFEILTGESMPSGTPYRLGVMMNQNSGKLFEYIRENVGLFWEEVLKEWVIPTFEKDIDMEHVFEIFDTETANMVYERDVNRRVNEAVKKSVLATGLWPDQMEIDLIKEQMMAEKGDTEFVKIPKGYYDFDKELIIDITGEQINAAAKVETINNLLQLLAQNPQIVSLPETKGLFSDLLQLVGVGPNRIKSSQGQPALNQMGPGSPGMPGMMGNVPMANGAQ